jgi:hypothetical protein
MKDANANKVFAAAVAAKVKKANELGLKTTWSQEDHHRAMAQVLAEADVPPGVDPKQLYFELIQDCYNTSAFGHFLEKKFAGTGHFVRRDGKAKTVSAFEAELAAQMGQATVPTPPQA